jgi:biotin transport system permease protein
VLPVFITTVAYARQTGDALAARGLGEPGPEDDHEEDEGTQDNGTPGDAGRR